MEITLNIPQNDYVQPTEVRQFAVQTICDYLLRNSSCILHPKNDGPYRQANLYLRRKEGEENWRGMCNWHYAEEKGFEHTLVRGVEVQAAFDALIKAGYCIFRVWEYRTWMGYCCSGKPRIDGGERVTQFTEFID